MRKQLRSFALLTCITAATAFGGTIAMADTSPAPEQTGLKGEQMHKHQHRKGERGHGQRGQHGQRGHHFFKKIARQLELTDQQKTQAKAIFESNREQNKELIKSARTAKHELRTLVQSGSADESAIRAQAAKLSVAEADLAVERAQGAKQFLALLTPEQVAKLKAIRAKQETRSQRAKGFACDSDM